MKAGALSNRTARRFNLSNVDGGADRNRTCDLLIANETLYQLSYDPITLIVNDLQANQKQSKTLYTPICHPPLLLA